MILTVTPNTGLDRIFFLDRLEQNRRNQARAVVESMGGKGCDVALFLAELGEEAVATGIAAGDTGRRMEALLRAGGVTPDFVWAAGETRVNVVLLEAETGAHTTLCAPSLHADAAARAALLDWIARWAARAEAVVLAGSLPEDWPPEAYGDLVRAAGPGKRPVIVDAAGAQLAAALAAGPVAAVKPNRAELESLTGPVPDRAAASGAAAALRARGADWVLASLGAEGAILASASGVWSARPPAGPVVNPAGAGDGMAAALALGRTRGWDELETLRWATAIATAVVANPGTAELRRPQVQKLLPAVHVVRER